MDRDAVARAIERIVAEEQPRHPIPGVSVGVISGADEVAACFGVTNVEQPLAVTPDTLFQIGSITKTFLATLVMRLVEQGRLDLDVPVRRWVPELRLRDEDVAARVTLRHLLTHHAGWFGDHFVDLGSNDDVLARYVASMSDLEQQVPLGSEYAYNNAAFSLAGRIVEVVTEWTAEEAVRELLLAPLGLERTFFFADEAITYRVAAGHRDFDGVAQVVRPWALPRDNNCRGGLSCSVRDLLAYARFHMGDGTAAGGHRYLSSESLALMAMPLAGGPLGQHRGIGWSVQELDGVRVITHGGGTFGQQSSLLIAPAKRFALAVLTNSRESGQLVNALTRWFWGMLGVPVEAPRPLAAEPPAATTVLGMYRQPAEELRIVRVGDALVLQEHPLETSIRRLMRNPPPLPRPVALSFSREDRLLLLEGARKDSEIELLGPEWIRFGGRLYRKVA